MSPELLNPEVQGYYPTKYSDCYALGMVTYEVLGRRIPFYQYANSVIPGRVLGGDRPERPQGAERAGFTDDVWDVLGRCWEPQPANRPKVEDVLLCLEKASRSWMPGSPRSLAVSSTDSSPTRGFSDVFTAERETGDESWLSYPSSGIPFQLSESLEIEESAGAVSSVGCTSLLDQFWY